MASLRSWKRHFPADLLTLSLFLPFLAGGGCKRAPRTWALDGAGLQVRHVQPKVKAGQGEIPIGLEARGPLSSPPRLVWTPAGGKEVNALPMKPKDGGAGKGSFFQAKLPFLGPGKGIRYHFLLAAPKGGHLRFPEKGDFQVTCKGGVSHALLLAHIGAMFLGLVFLVLVAFRCLVYLKKGASLLSATRMVKWATFFIFLGGVPLGMLVERKVFGTWWEGWPFGRDVTDTKTGLILLWWILLSFLAPDPERASQKKARTWAWAVLVCLVLTVALYVVPHENLKF